ncbi:adenosylmethionine--8-amino-7-oxononanoate transaminase [Inhella gelatinilytica]|uniref:Adenosylmethionine-8-amino-7-oxononanoate aminotransferase n=1 Tax=Inhella gelatinilytica TaxID=2795030 RepID=A0A931IV72_9BURK|nr:adenosylmethionine--8-amino-7-oxononanoate transaminase [Inhella gelatinilytica]MBH9551278.1 adenosylmethionine--8-amino-7-oxononanoate transaminase [Inhella gelatinilytica]
MTPHDLAARSRAAIWHPCTQMARLDAVPPLPIARGEGPWLFDTEGRRYFDANSSWWVNLFGHADAGLAEAIATQARTLPHVMLAGCTHEPAVELAERLSARTGGALGHAFYGSDGASATEIALKMSAHHWRNLGQPEKCEFIALAGGYHGETLGALSVTDVAIFRDAYAPLLRATHLAPALHESGALAAIEAKLVELQGRCAAVIVEPLIQGASGMRMHGPEVLRELRALCTRQGAHLIADEIAVGCGRTGSFFAWEQVRALGAEWPDFILLSKGITGGTLPLSLVLTTDAVFEAFLSDDVARGFLHSHSYTGNAIACAAANEVLRRMETLLPTLSGQAAALREAFAPLLHDDARIENGRQTGMVLAFDVKPGVAGERFAERFHLAARQHELLIRPIGRTVYLMPPYVIDASIARWLVEVVARTLNDVCSV